MIQFRYPKALHVGDEVAGLALKLPESKHIIRITFLWGNNDYIKVLGAHMVRPNVFEFPPHKDEQPWYLKFAVSSDAQPCQKIPYLTIHELRTKTWPVWLARIAASILFLASLVVLFSAWTRTC